MTTFSNSDLLDNAVDVAKRLWSGARGYETPEKAAKALGRRVPGQSLTVTLESVTLATTLIERAIELSRALPQPKPPELYPSDESQREIGNQLGQAFPQFTDRACQIAAAWGVFVVWK